MFLQIDNRMIFLDIVEVYSIGASNSPIERLALAAIGVGNICIDECRLLGLGPEGGGVCPGLMAKGYRAVSL